MWEAVREFLRVKVAYFSIEVLDGTANVGFDYIKAVVVVKCFAKAKTCAMFARDAGLTFGRHLAKGSIL